MSSSMHQLSHGQTLTVQIEFGGIMYDFVKIEVADIREDHVDLKVEPWPEAKYAIQEGHT